MKRRSRWSTVPGPERPADDGPVENEVDPDLHVETETEIPSVDTPEIEAD